MDTDEIYAIGTKVTLIDDAADTGIFTITKKDGSRLEVEDENGSWGVLRTWDVELADDED